MSIRRGCILKLHFQSPVIFRLINQSIQSFSPGSRLCKPDETFPGNSHSIFPPISRSSRLSVSFLAPLHFHSAALCSSVPIATLADVQQVTVSRGTERPPPPLATRPASFGCDWPDLFRVFTETKS